jgi:hypothetical protein
LENFFSFSNGPATDHHLFGLCHLLITAQLAHLLGNVIHLGPKSIALGGDLPQASIEGDSFIELAQDIGFATAAQSGPHTVKVGTQQSDINHEHEATCPC